MNTEFIVYLTDCVCLTWLAFLLFFIVSSSLHFHFFMYLCLIFVSQSGVWLHFLSPTRVEVIFFSVFFFSLFPFDSFLITGYPSIKYFVTLLALLQWLPICYSFVLKTLNRSVPPCIPPPDLSTYVSLLMFPHTHLRHRSDCASWTCICQICSIHQHLQVPAQNMLPH